MHRLIAPVIAATLALPASAMDLTELTDAERAQFRAEVRSYLMDNPEVIMEAVELLQSREAEAQANADLSLVSDNAAAIFEDGYSWVGGNPDGDIVLVEFLDYRCGYCRKAVPEVASLLKSDGNIRLIVKEFPILGEGSLLSSRFAVATKLLAGDKYYEQVHDALLELDADATEVTLRRIGDGLGLDTEEIIAHMQSEEVTDILRKNHALAKELAISGTPTFVLQDRMLRGYLPADQMAQIIAEIRG